MYIWNLLADEGNSGGGLPSWVIWIVLGVLVLVAVAYFFFSGRKNKQRRQEYMEQIEAIAPGNKVKTTGGICGIVVEVCDDNTVIIETGTEQSGKSYIKMDKECIYQTDAKGPTQIAREEAEARRKAEKEAKAQPVTPAEGDAEKEPAAEEPAADPDPVEAPAAGEEEEK